MFAGLLITALSTLIISTLSCTNTKKQELSQTSIKAADTLKMKNYNPDTLQTLPDSINITVHEIPDSLNDWKETSVPGNYYKDIMLTMQIVDIINPQLKMYLSDYIIPLVKRKDFDRYENYIIVSYEKRGLDLHSREESVEIHILVDYCGITYRFAHDIYDGKYKVAIIDGLPVMFENFKIKGYIKDTPKIYEFRKWRKDFIWLLTCELECEFYFVVKDKCIYFTGYSDWGLNLVWSESELPEIWKSEQVEQAVILHSDSLMEEKDSLAAKQFKEEFDTSY